jgi:hypothetical protein
MNFRKTNFGPGVRMNTCVLCYTFLASFRADVDKLARDTKRKKSHRRMRQIGVSVHRNGKNIFI